MVIHASLDTNVIIHLYRAGLQEVLFNRFDKIVVYGFIRDVEMENHASTEIKELFDKDVNDGKIKIITNEELRNIGMIGVFDTHVKEQKILFDPSDLGEVYAIAIAKTLGFICLVTDDIKPGGPHYSLMRFEDSQLTPLTFYEILFLDYIEGKIDIYVLEDKFDVVCKTSELNLLLKSAFSNFVRRFWKSPYSESEREWMKLFCSDKGINDRQKIVEFNNFLKSTIR